MGEQILTQYKKINPNDIKSLSSELEQGQFMYRLFYLELMIAQNNLFKTLDNSEVKDLFTEAIRKSKEKKEYGYSSFQIRSTCLLLGRLLVFNKCDEFAEKISRKSNEYNSFLEAIFLTNQEILEEIKESANEYINRQFNEVVS